MNGEPIRVIADDVKGFQAADPAHKREKIFTRHVGGRFQQLRFYTGWPLLLGYFILPWLRWGDRPAVLFDLPSRQFHILSTTFWPQDLWLLGGLLIIAAFALFTVTNVVGRLWCGYTCPQTIWTAIFMWIEQVTEGSRNARIRLDRAPWSRAKVAKRFSKHTLWLAVSALTGLTFVGYFVPIRELSAGVLAMDAPPWAAFWMLFFATATYLNAGWLRERVCIHMCPYARFQSAMFDENTLIVSYNSARGEPRSSRKRAPAADAAGDCVDCRLCVQVCPTGIDIRNGLQYECIGCAHCIDACDQVMDKLARPRGLIGYTTEQALAGSPAKRRRPRTMGYASALLLVTGAFGYALTVRVPLELDVLRDRSALFHEVGDAVDNHFQLKLMNKSQQNMRVSLTLISTAELSSLDNTVIDIAAGEVLDLPMRVRIGKADLAGAAALPFHVRACAEDGETCVSEANVLLGPGR